MNLADYYPGAWDDRQQAYISSYQVDSTLYRAAIFDPDFPTYRPPGTASGNKLNNSLNVKPLRYF